MALRSWARSRFGLDKHFSVCMFGAFRDHPQANMFLKRKIYFYMFLQFANSLVFLKCKKSTKKVYKKSSQLDTKILAPMTVDICRIHFTIIFIFLFSSSTEIEKTYIGSRKTFVSWQYWRPMHHPNLSQCLMHHLLQSLIMSEWYMGWGTWCYEV